MAGLAQSSLRARFAYLTGLLMVLVIGVSALLIHENATISTQAAAVAEREFPVLNKAHALKLAVVQVQQWLTDISATRGRDGLNDGFDEAAKNAELALALLAELEQLDPDHAESYRNLVPVFQDYYRVGRSMAQAYIDAGPEGGNPMMASFDEVAGKMTDELEVLLTDVTGRATQAVRTQQAAVERVRNYLWSSAALILATLVLFYVLIARVLNILPRIVDELRKVADGDLTSRYELDRADEIGQLVRAVSDMRGQLRDVVTRILTASRRLTTSAEEMSATTAQASSSIDQQRHETGQLAAAMTEMSATAREVSSNIAHSATAAEDAHRATGQGRAVVEQAIRQITDLAHQIENSSETVSQMEQNSVQISSVLDVIRNVADQTNLLALNAAIEAARAGDKGRGFAVVADEVRTLARRTQNSTQDINRMIEMLRTATSSVVDIMNNSRQQARAVVESASAAGASLGTAAAAVARINDMSTQIASAAEEQTAVGEEITRNVVRIDTMNEQSAALAEQTAVSGNELAHLASELESMVQGFRT